VDREQHVIKAPSSGVLTRLVAYGIGVAPWAGRARNEDPVQAGAGVELTPGPVAYNYALCTSRSHDRPRSGPLTRTIAEHTHVPASGEVLTLAGGVIDRMRSSARPVSAAFAVRQSEHGPQERGRLPGIRAESGQDPP
jgi:thymidine phosphorylase